MQLALEEAVSNVMRYAYPGEMKRKITILATDKGEDVMFEIDDEGIPFDPLAKADPDVTLKNLSDTIGGQIEEIKMRLPVQESFATGGAAISK